VTSAGSFLTTNGTKLEILPGVYSPELGNRRDILVQLPGSYPAADRTYPVLYMHDGQNLFDPATAYAGDWRLGKVLAVAARRGLEAIVVGIPNMGAERVAEYSPFRNPAAGDGAGDRYLDFLLQTLKPIIDQRFRTRPEPAASGIAGSSMGGLISLYGFFRSGGAYGFAGVLSPSLWFADDAIFDAVESAPNVPGRIYLDIGSLEGLEHVVRARRMRDLLRRKGYRIGRDLKWLESRSGRHEEASWGRRFARALPFLLGQEAQ
jgi:predicted alpha/beta superfamily hydrolase